MDVIEPSLLFSLQRKPKLSSFASSPKCSAQLQFKSRSECWAWLTVSSCLTMQRSSLPWMQISDYSKYRLPNDVALKKLIDLPMAFFFLFGWFLDCRVPQSCLKEQRMSFLQKRVAVCPGIFHDIIIFLQMTNELIDHVRHDLWLLIKEYVITKIKKCDFYESFPLPWHVDHHRSFQDSTPMASAIFRLRQPIKMTDI